MAAIQITVNVLDEHCATCNCLNIEKHDLYGGIDIVSTEFSCTNLHMCRYIRNRIVRNEENKEEKA